MLRQTLFPTGVATTYPLGTSVPSTRHPWQTRLFERLQRGPARRPWREAVRGSTGADRSLRGLVFASGLVLVLVGATMWLVSSLATAPLVLAGLWVWSWEFAWARRLQHRFRLHLRSAWKQARRRPVRWALGSLGGIAVGAAGYWAFLAYGPM